eukprot:CAMPEP_0172436386 /NCGR_PEP_ID=MMETSP1064-20121228/71696_1 /TAXON_ID=202472 /ORGANISM="Aulacoseira subarctica , Strain CCAP 1002/5" /LENGTH=495 /DNA_ID=CAMNT_0013184787 /DNA_START=261 /DNA_END=1748 /DNA_ORIENTATION=+
MIFGAMADKAPRSRFIAALPLGILAVLLGSISLDCVNAHGYCVSPRSRNFLAHSSQEGREQGQGTSTTPLAESTPQGIFRLQTTGRCGYADHQYDAPKNSLGGIFRNFLAHPTQEGREGSGTSTTPLAEYTPQGINQMTTAGRCGMGDNGIGAAWRQYDAPKNAFGGALPPKIQATYVKGQQIDLQVVLTAHHKGHFTYSACALSAGQTTATQQCFDANKLMFVKDNLYGAPKDTRYPDRAYIPLTSFPGIQIVNSAVGATAYRFNHRFQLPAGLSGDLVLIQWTYWTANSCIYPGYRTMSFPANYYDQGGLPDCTRTDFVTYLGGGIPELFWNCIEVKILNTPAPAPAPLPAPQPTTTTSGVTVCQDSNYQGLCVTLAPGNYDLPAMTSRGVQNDWISSVKVPSGYSMTGYWDAGFLGSSVTYTTDTAYIGNDWNDKISSLKVTSVTGGKLIGQWQTCRKNVDWCDPNWTCCVAPADVATQKATCRPTCCGWCA